MRCVALTVGLLAGVLLAACGGGGGDQPAVLPTTTGQTPATIVTVTATQQPEQAPDAELIDYLDLVKVEQDEYLQLREKVQDTLDSINKTGADETWVAAAENLREARDEYDELAIRMTGIKAPEKLRVAHRQLAKSLQLFAQFLDEFQRPLADKDVANFIAAPDRLNALSNRTSELRSDWRVATSAYARSLDVETPTWISTLGKSP